jgi:hypothetical protein
VLLAVTLIGIALVGAVVTPLWLIRKNPDKTVLKENNEGTVPFLLFFTFSFACGIMGCLLLPRGAFLALIALGVTFPLPLQIGARIHNRRIMNT